ncbi:MAG: phosphonate C-P lyase system protein PhnH [Deltaproteobacteria bacterium]|nr:phosphonate C-P lyase system protein PhnH [Deltaproteobacteria bacterium]
MLHTGPLQPGFKDPVLDSQQVFMASLKAMSHPGSVIDLPVLPPGPEPLLASTAALLLTLLDWDTRLWLDPPAANKRVLGWLAFHCGCRIIKEPAEANFVVVGDGRHLPDLTRFAWGTEDSPEGSATIIIQVQDLAQGQGRFLTGPGIEDRTRLSVQGLDDSFWHYPALNSRLFPQGLDFFLAGPGSVCGLPRTTSVEG